MLRSHAGRDVNWYVIRISPTARVSESLVRKGENGREERETLPDLEGISSILLVSGNCHDGNQGLDLFTAWNFTVIVDVRVQSHILHLFVHRLSYDCTGTARLLLHKKGFCIKQSIALAHPSTSSHSILILQSIVKLSQSPPTTSIKQSVSFLDRSTMHILLPCVL